MTHNPDQLIYQHIDQIWERSGAWPAYVKAMRQGLLGDQQSAGLHVVAEFPVALFSPNPVNSWLFNWLGISFHLNPFDQDSTSNQFGRYGSPFSPDSPNNPYGSGWRIEGRE